MMMKQKYKEEFINLGFTKVIWNAAERPKCVLCGKAISNRSLETNELDRCLKMYDLSIGANQKNDKAQCFDSSVYTKLNIHIF